MFYHSWWEDFGMLKAVIVGSSLFEVLNPNQTGGGGGWNPPPSTFRAIISREFFSSFESCATFDAIFVKIGRTVPKLRNVM